MADVAEARIALGPVGNATCSIEITNEPWTLPIDALAVSVGLDGFGRLGAAFVEATGARVMEDDVRGVTPDHPGVIALPAGAAVIEMLLTSVREPAPGVTYADSAPPVTIGAAGRAAASCVRLANQRGRVRWVCHCSARGWRDCPPTPSPT